ncbi:hypothetical protein KDH_29690 [Dictyobacter sp. S3.2.2.5]|uniref:D,D-heptose 1,7-bisphosphate phosphatase n=1 Tax=Dictyobacter halimunensis TaxID=3026934 RepID=A0ABQ6FS50_9CHLR|nr:hypothetical protein KDH_29690 [Dictyobacter sp. S3.2.2.5]
MKKDRRAVFLDRDGTLVHPFHYPSRPEHLRVYEGIGPALHRLQARGFALILITNQSGVARGYFNEKDLARMHTYLQNELALTFDGIYFCPHHPDGIIPELSIRCNCRKPEPGMLFQAANDLDLATSASWFVGDILDDIEAGNRAGSQTILVDIGTEQVPELAIRKPNFVARDTLHALTIIETVSSLELDVDLVYSPSSWRTGLPHA